MKMRNRFISGSWKVLLIAALFLLTPFPGFSMHIAEGFLPPVWCIIWAIAFLPFLIWGYQKLRKTIAKNPEGRQLYAVIGAFVFVLSSLKLPSVAGSSSHLTGIALGALIFGASSMSVVGLIVLIFQALLLAHGGLTTLGANAFSMAVIGALMAVATYNICKRCKVNLTVAIFLAAFISDISTYVCTSFQLSLAFQGNGDFWGNVVKFMSVFAVTQIPLAFAEGFLTVFLFKLLQKYSASDLIPVAHKTKQSQI